MVDLYLLWVDARSELLFDWTESGRFGVNGVVVFGMLEEEDILRKVVVTGRLQLTPKLNQNGHVIAKLASIWRRQSDRQVELGLGNMWKREYAM